MSTPAFHHWHHTNDENRDHNYAALLPAVDRLFGTHHLPAHWPPTYGVDEPPPPGVGEEESQGLLDQEVAAAEKEAKRMLAKVSRRANVKTP